MLRPAIKNILRPGIVAAIVTGLICLMPAAKTFAQAKKTGVGAVVTKTLTTNDNFPIAITYYESKLKQDAPVVILLHMKDSNQLVWKRSFAQVLQLRGYAVVTVDLRGHGESVPGGVTKGSGKVKLRPVDYVNMVKQDLETVKKFIMEEHHDKKLNVRKLGIVATDMSAPIAATFASLDWLKTPYPDAPTLPARTPRGQDVRAMVLLSPLENVPGVSGNKAYAALRGFGVAFMVGYGTGDSKDRGGKSAKQIYDLVTNKNAKENITYEVGYPTKLRGTDMLGRRLKVEENIVVFLDKHLAKLTDPWVNRKSRLGGN